MSFWKKAQIKNIQNKNAQIDGWTNSAIKKDTFWRQKNT